MDMPHALAYKAVDEKNQGRYMYALVCNHNLQPRLHFVATLKAFRHKGVLNLNEFGVVYHIPAKAWQMAFIYDLPLGGRVMKTLNDTIDPIPEKDFITRIAPIMVSALYDLAQRGITHRAIRPDNLYYVDRAKTVIAFGDMLTVPPAFDQSVEFEPIVSAMCAPEGRGGGRLMDDLYSFGVTSLYLTIGRKPRHPFSNDEEILEAKIKKGSYATLVAEERIPLSIIELLKGLLSDNEDQRWNIENLRQWLTGRRLSPMQSRAGKVSQRAFQFNGKEYFTTRELARDFAKNWQLAADAVRSEKLHVWLYRGLEDKKLHDLVQSILGNTILKYPSVKVQNNVLVTKICLLFDKNACIRYKNLNFLPDGLGGIIANAYLKGDPSEIANIIEMLQIDIISIYFEIKQNTSYSNAYKVLSTYVNHPSIGSGLERCLYHLNEFLPCRSKFLAKEYVNEIYKLVPAMDRVAKTVDIKIWPMDRHIAAYIAEKFDNKTHDQINALKSENLAVATAGLVSIYAVLQWNLGPEAVNSLAGWLGYHITPIVESYHSKERQKIIEKELPKLIKKGSLPELFNYLDNLEERTKDYNGFMIARSEYLSLSREIEQFEVEVEKINYESEQMGMQVATVASFGISLFTIVMTLLLRLM